MTSVLWKPKSNEIIKEITSQSNRVYLVMEPGRDTTPKEGSGNMKLLEKVAEKFEDMHFDKSKFLSRNTPEEWVNTIEDVFSEDVIMEETKKGKEKRFCFTPQTSIIIPNSVYWQKLQPKSEVQFRPTVTLRLKRKKGEKSLQMKKAPRKNKTQKKAPAKGKKAPAKGKVSEDGSGFIPAAAMSRLSLNSASDSDSSSAIQSLDSDEDAIENDLSLFEPSIDSDHKKNPKAFPALRKGNPILKNLDYNKMKGKFPDEWKKGEGKNGEPKWWKKLFVKEGDDKTLYISRNDWNELYQSYAGKNSEGIQELFEYLVEFGEGIFENFYLIKDEKVAKSKKLDVKPKAKSSSESGSDPEGYSSSASSVLDYGSDASTDLDDLLDAYGNSTAYSIARTRPGTSAYYARMDKYDRRREKEEEFEKRKKMKKELDDDLLEKVKKGMDVYDAHEIQTERWDRMIEEEEMRAYEDQMTSEDESSESESEEDRKRRNELLNLEYARANGWSKQRDKEGTVFYTHSESGATVLGNKDGLLEPHLAHDAYDKAMKQKNTMSSGTSSGISSSTMSLPNVNTGAPRPWVQRTSKSTGKKYWYNPATQITFYPTKKNAPNGEWTQKDADDAAERAKKKGGKKSRKKKKKTRRKKGGKRKKTKKRKLRKKRKTRR
jgi:hypothetical protein